MCAPWLVLPAAAALGWAVLNLVYVCVAGGGAFLGGDRMGWTCTRATAVMTRLVADMAIIFLFVRVSVYLWWLSDHVAKIFLC